MKNTEKIGFFFDFGIDSYYGMYDCKYSVGAKLAYDLGYRNSRCIDDRFRNCVRRILQNKITKADIRERMKWHEFNGPFNMWHHVVENGVVKQMPFFSPLEVSGWYDDRYVIPAVVMKDRWFDEGYKEFQEKCKKRTLEYLKKHHIKNTKITYKDNMKKSYNIQLRNMLKNGTFVNVEKQLGL